MSVDQHLMSIQPTHILIAIHTVVVAPLTGHFGTTEDPNPDRIRFGQLMGEPLMLLKFTPVVVSHTNKWKLR